MLSVNNDEREKKVLELYDQGKSTGDCVELIIPAETVTTASKGIISSYLVTGCISVVKHWYIMNKIIIYWISQ
jgi:hypothetical protein